MPKDKLDTLVEDIYSLFGEGVAKGLPTDDTIFSMLGDSISDTLRTRLTTERKRSGSVLRMSALGKPDRQLWYEQHLSDPKLKEQLDGKVHLKFLSGDIWEAVLLTLAKAAGHEVTHEQAEVELNGVLGHMDAVIDGVVVDVKSASTYAFQKFERGTLEEDDPFGYMEQLASYCTAMGGLDGAFLAVDKQTCRLALLRYPYELLKTYAMTERIDHLREVLENKEEEPERCYEPVPYGKSGNMALGVNCSYCPFKHYCWRDANDGIGIRTFLYSNRPVHLVDVQKQPKVHEVTF